MKNLLIGILTLGSMSAFADFSAIDNINDALAITKHEVNDSHRYDTYRPSTVRSILSSIKKSIIASNTTVSSPVTLDFNNTALNFINLEDTDTYRFDSYRPATVRNIMSQIQYILDNSKKYEKQAISVE